MNEPYFRSVDGAWMVPIAPGRFVSEAYASRNGLKVLKPEPSPAKA